MNPADNAFGFQWHITGRCHGKCRHCYQSAADGAPELPVDALKRIADGIMLAVSGPVTINVTGGEPLMYQSHAMNHGVFELMSHLSTFGNLDELNIITTAQGLDNSIIRALKSIPKLSYVKVSLESHDPQINDSIRGSGHYSMAVDGIRQLAKSGLQVIIMATLSKRNCQSVSGLCSLAEDLGTHGVIFERFVPLGRGLIDMRDETVSPKEWREILTAISAVTQAPTEDLSPYKAFWVDGDSVSGAPCCLGPSSMALMPGGTVYPCRRVPNPIGKLPGDGMDAILKKLEEYASVPQQCFDFGG
ncbi:MAG: radical SAM protein [Chitinispirillia bacterium]|nr:radical SAM protein [Chitinispirillia bacterium]MCL2242569.1 radical SAM protein [Chitinispirillia bacterium]